MTRLAKGYRSLRSARVILITVRLPFGLRLITVRFLTVFFMSRFLGVLPKWFIGAPVSVDVGDGHLDILWPRQLPSGV